MTASKDCFVKIAHLFRIRAMVVLVLLPLISACSSVHKLAGTPNLYAQSPYPAQKIASSEQGASSKIYYVTDRQQHIHDGELLSLIHI